MSVGAADGEREAGPLTAMPLVRGRGTVLGTHKSSAPASTMIRSPDGPIILEEGEEDGSGQALTPIDLLTVLIDQSDRRSGMPPPCFLVQ